MPDSAGEITEYLRRLKAGDASAEQELAEAVYARMREIGRATVFGGSYQGSLQPTALANEVLLELIRARNIDWQDREHFFRIASRTMRRRLIDHIRNRKAGRRPPKNLQANVEDAHLPGEERFDEILIVHQGLDQLAAFDPQLAEIVELVFFGGLSIATVAELRGVSEKTIDRKLDLARRWLRKNLSQPCPRGAETHALSVDQR